MHNLEIISYLMHFVVQICILVSLSLSSLVKTETKLAVNYWYLINFCIPCKRRWLINDLIDIWFFPSVYVFWKKTWFRCSCEVEIPTLKEKKTNVQNQGGGG